MINEQVKDAVILSIMILEGMEEIREQIVDFPGEWADLLLALNQLKLATDKATKVREEYIRRAEAATKEKERGSGVSEAIREFKRKIGWMSDEEAEEYIDKWTKKADRILNTPDGIEIGVVGETEAPGNQGGREISLESSDDVGTSTETDAGGCEDHSP